MYIAMICVANVRDRRCKPSGSLSHQRVGVDQWPLKQGPKTVCWRRIAKDRRRLWNSETSTPHAKKKAVGGRGRSACQPRITPEIGTPVPAVTSTCSTSGPG